MKNKKPTLAHRVKGAIKIAEDMRPGYVTPLHTLKHQNSSKHAESCCHVLPQIFFVQLVTNSRQPSLLAVALQHFVGRTKSILPTSSSQKSAGSSVGPAAEVPPICALWLQSLYLRRGKGQKVTNSSFDANGSKWRHVASKWRHVAKWISVKFLLLLFELYLTQGALNSYELI